MRLSKLFAVLLLAGAAIAAFAQAPSAEQTYNDARRALNRNELDRAVTEFRALRRDYPESQHVGDSYYWEARALERNGNLDGARQALDTLLREHPDAATNDDARGLRIQVCSDLARRGDAQCAADIAPQLRDPGQLDSAMKGAAMNALMNMRADKAIPIATQVLNNRGQPQEVRRQALFILADKAEEAGLEPQVTATLLATARDTTDSIEIRKQAVFWLSELPGEQTFAALRDLVTTGDNAELRQQAIFALSQQESPQGLEFLSSVAENETMSVEQRKQAIFWLADAYEERAVPFLTELYGKLTDVELKKQVLFAVSETEDDDALGWLLERAGDTREPIEVRKQALFWAAEAGLPAAAIRSLYGRTAERELREQLIWLLSEDDGPAAFDGLLEIARTDPDPEMRKKAIFWIGESDDPRAEQFLTDVLLQGVQP